VTVTDLLIREQSEACYLRRRVLKRRRRCLVDWRYPLVAEGLEMCVHPSDVSRTSDKLHSTPGLNIQMKSYSTTLPPRPASRWLQMYMIPMRQCWLSCRRRRLYSVIYPSDYMVQRMVELGLLRQLEPARLSGLNNLSLRFQNPPMI